jgi:diguanylate cyclase (GGDEF)-like protein
MPTQQAEPDAAAAARHGDSHVGTFSDVAGLGINEKEAALLRHRSASFEIVTACSVRAGTVTFMQSAPPNLHKIPRIFGQLVWMRQAHAWLLVLFCADAVAVIDLLTGPDLWLGPVYLLVICVAAWSLGWVRGQVTGIACMAIALAINGLRLYPYGDIEFAVNLLMRFGALSIVVAAISGARWAFVREWWLARTDLLTGALNRQAFFELAPSSISDQRWRLLVYADLDGLKKVNDFQGHAAGDACLRAFGVAVRKAVRRDDVFARLGGDEFVLFMSVRDQAAAETLAARLHAAMNDVQTDHGKLNCSVGGLVVPPGRTSMDQLVLSADDLMYRAKLLGACLQIGNYSGVERPLAVGAARNSPGAREMARKGSANDRRRVPAPSAIVPVR